MGTTSLSPRIEKPRERATLRVDSGDIADLELTPGAVLLITKAMNTDLEGVPVQYSISRFAADRVQFTIEN